MGILKRKKRADPAQEPEVDAAILRAWLSGESVGSSSNQDVQTGN